MSAHERLIALYLAIGAALSAGYFTLGEPLSAFCYLAMSALPLVGLGLGVRMHEPRAVRPWLLLACGQAAFLLGDATWFAQYLPTQTDPPLPSSADPLYLLGYPLLAVGVMLFIRARQPRYRLTAALDALVIGLAGVLTLWLVAIDSVVHDETLGLIERAVLLAYPIGDVLILAAAVYLLLSGRQSKSALYLLVLSLVALLAADVVYAVIPDADLAANLTDALWLGSYVLFGLTALVPSMRNLTQPSDAPTAPEGTLRLVILGLAISAVPAFALIQRWVIGHEDLPVVIAAAGVILIAVLVRMRELVAVHRRAESRYASLLANASDAFAIVSPDGRLTYASAASDRVLGYGAGQLVGRSVLEFVHPQAVALAAALLRGVAEHPGAQRESELEIQRGDGDWRWLNVVATNRSDDPNVNGVVLNLRDVTERREHQLRLDLQARVLNEVQHAVLVTDGDGRVSYWNRAAETMLGWTADEVAGRHLVDIGLLADRQQADEFLARLTGGGRMSGEYELCRRDGSKLTALVTNSAMGDGDDSQRGMIAVAVDISDRKQLEQRLQQQAFSDALTGLANRALFLDRVKHVLAGQRRGAKDTPAVLFIDLDDFKTVNDSMGHFAGDALLVLLAERLGAMLRPTDTAARLGGDEFAVLLEDTSLADAERIAQRVLAELAGPVPLDDREVRVSASIGIAVPAADGTTDAEELLRNADLAMYRAKARMQGSYAVYQPVMHEAALRRLELKADLQRAIYANGLSLEYQPILRLRDNKPVGAEALLRWRHPERGLVPVAETLALAEAAGLVVPLGSWVLNSACRVASDWRTKLGRALGTEPLFVAVNASARELLDPTYPDIVAAALARSGLPAESLSIEITESDLMQESEAAIGALRNLKELGVRLSIDDFGTGYSSLAYLARFPLDVLKIDRTFVSSQAAGQDGAIVKAIIDLAGSLGLEVIAEGVEREVDRELMASLGADYGQGFHLGRPMSGLSMLAVLRGRGARQPKARRVRTVSGAFNPSEP